MAKEKRTRAACGVPAGSFDREKTALARSGHWLSPYTGDWQLRSTVHRGRAFGSTAPPGKTARQPSTGSVRCGGCIQHSLCQPRRRGLFLEEKYQTLV